MAITTTTIATAFRTILTAYTQWSAGWVSGSDICSTQWEAARMRGVGGICGKSSGFGTRPTTSQRIGRIMVVALVVLAMALLWFGGIMWVLSEAGLVTVFG